MITVVRCVITRSVTIIACGIGQTQEGTEKVSAVVVSGTPLADNGCGAMLIHRDVEMQSPPKQELVMMY